MKPNIRGLGIAFLAALAVAAATISAAQTGPTWLDVENPVAWHEPGAPIPAAPKFQGEIDPRCVEQARPAELPEDDLLTARGWRLSGAYEGGWGVLIIRATTDYDGMCRPLGYHAFVFVDGVFAGTLSPEPMYSRNDGALGQVFVFQTVEGLELLADYARYAGNDALCCPSRTTSVTFLIDRDAPAVRPVSAGTYANQ